MRWVVSCTPDTRILTERLFQGAVALDYFSITDDDRASSHALNTAVSESQTLTFSEEILFGCGPNSCSILNSPFSPVRMVLSSYFKKVSARGDKSSNSNHSNRLVTMSISSFQGDMLASGGTPLALKVAQGLGIITNEQQSIVSPFANLKFGSRKSSGHVIQIKSPVEADSIINSLFKSLSFQRHLPSMSLCVRLSFAIYSDAPDDGDDFPNWVNEQIITLWFVNDRHVNEFLTTFDRSVKSGFPTRLIIGFAKINSFESAAKCADTAAHSWQIVNNNGTFLPISISGRPVGPNQLFHQPHLGGVNASVFSPFTSDLQSTHNFAVTQRKRLLEETAAYLNNVASDHAHVELQASRDELEQLGQIYDESEKKFTELAQQLEIEREKFRATEDEVKSVADGIERGEKAMKEQEERRKEMVAKVSTLTNIRDDLKRKAGELKDKHLVVVRAKELDDAKYQNELISDAVKRQDEIDAYRKSLQLNAEQERRHFSEKISALRSQLEQAKSNLGKDLQFEHTEKQSELDLLRQRQRKLIVDHQDVDNQLNSLRTQILSLQAEQFNITQAQSPELFESQGILARQQLLREQVQLDELKQHLVSLEGRKSALLSNQLEIEETSRAEVEKAKVEQLRLSEEAKALIDEELDLLQEQEDHIRYRLTSEFDFGYHSFQTDFWLDYNRVSVGVRLKNAEVERETVISKVNEVKGEISELSYQSMQLDGDIETLSEEVKEANIVKTELKNNLNRSLADIREEKAKLLQALAGNGTSAFPLLDAQREVLEERFSLLQRCIALPSLTFKNGTSNALPSEHSHTLLTRQSIDEDLNDLSLRLQECMNVMKVDKSYLTKMVDSLNDKRRHLTDEEQMRSNIIAQLTSSDNELGRVISALKDEIQQMSKEAMNLQISHSRLKHDNSMSNDEDRKRQFDEETKILHRISEEETKLQLYEKRRSDNYRRLKMNKSRLEALKKKQVEIWNTSKEVGSLEDMRRELLAALNC